MLPMVLARTDTERVTYHDALTEAELRDNHAADQLLASAEREIMGFEELEEPLHIKAVLDAPEALGV
jgi:hypothetical protein